MGAYIELLTADDDGKPVSGPKIPEDRGGAIKYPDPGTEFGTRVAKRVRFFRKDRFGRPVEPPEFAEFYVPEWLMNGANPTLDCLRLVVEKMGWGEH